MSGYELLANAIIEQAAKDYRNLLYALKINKNNRSARANKTHLEKFFHSEWYRTLSNVNDIVNNSWHIFLKHSHTYAVISKES